jgi:hypothetical protein
MLKDPVKLERETSSAKFTTNSLQVPPASFLLVTAKELWSMNEE